jgi:hypothetical protein
MSQESRGKIAVISLGNPHGNMAYTLTNGLSSYRLVADAFLHRQHGLSPFQQLLLLYGLSVCARVL